MRLAATIGFWVALTLLTAILGLLGMPALLFGEAASRRITKLWTRLALQLLKLIVGIDHRIEYPENIPQGGAIVASNHQSMWETIALYAILPRPVIVFKYELSWIPVYGWFVLRTKNIPINRKDGISAIRKLQRDAAERVENGNQVIVFPEGTRLKPGVVADYRAGVAGLYLAANADCAPVAHNSGEYWCHPELPKNPGTITVRFLPPIAPGMRKQAFMTRLKNDIDGARPDLNAMPAEQNIGTPSND